ncbi:MAG: hypothetical protein KC505_11115 [Myxococcales bacterium]|nr:hypothetical protein [Myxococcales bacterium]
MCLKKTILLSVLVEFISSCKSFPIKNFPLQIKAAIEGEIKGQRIHCEKNLDLFQGEWGVMCSVGNNTNVKYRAKPMDDGQTKLKFIIDKEKNGTKKVIAAPVLMLKNDYPAVTTSMTKYGPLKVTAQKKHE